jgi:4-amino-4-deoxy-L-arabinose transferase-like glycosyltransferase
LGAGPAKCAGWLWVFYPFAIYFSAGRVWDHALTALLLALCFWATVNLHHEKRLSLWLGYGALWGLTALVNPSVLSTFPFLLAIVAYKAGREHVEWRRNCLCAVLALVVVITPWIVRNYSTMRVAAPIRDNFWMEFRVGNTGDTSDLVPDWVRPSDNPTEMARFRSDGEVGFIAYERQASLEFLRNHPGYFLWLCVRRVVYYWIGFWSFESGYLRSEPTALPNLFLCTALTVLMLRGLFDWWRHDRDAAIYYAVTIVFFPLVYYVTDPMMDYRHPIEPQIVTLVTVGWQSFRSLRGNLPGQMTG